MTTWSPDICGCRIRCDRLTGAPLVFEEKCARHKNTGALPVDVGAECAAKERSRETVRATLDLAEAPDWVLAEDGTHQILLPEGLDKASLDRVSTAVAAVAHPELTRLTTTSALQAVQAVPVVSDALSKML